MNFFSNTGFELSSLIFFPTKWFSLFFFLVYSYSTSHDVSEFSDFDAMAPHSPLTLAPAVATTPSKDAMSEATAGCTSIVDLFSSKGECSKFHHKI
jgi:hypothetical protein